MSRFTAIVFPYSRKVCEITSEGIVEHLYSPDPDFADSGGIWIFESVGGQAVPIRQAEPWEKTALFNTLQLPQVGVLPVLKTSRWHCLPLNMNQYRKYVKVKASLPLFFTPENISRFDPLLARVYKHRRTVLLYEDINERYPTEQIEKLREAVKTRVKQNLHLPKELQTAFELAVESDKPPLERLVRHSLKLVNAQFTSLTDLGNGQYQVKYTYKGKSDSVVINDNLTVLNAGICLEGHDRDFDLSSIVLVKERAPSFAR